MDLAPLIERLRAQLTGFKAVGGAADLDAIGNGVVPSPSCYLFPMAESADDNATFGRFEQRVRVAFAVVLAATNRRDATGAAALADLEALRRDVKGALVGWPPDPVTGEPVHFTGGHLLRFEDGLLWWADEFIVTTYERSLL